MNTRRFALRVTAELASPPLVDITGGKRRAKATPVCVRVCVRVCGGGTKEE